MIHIATVHWQDDRWIDVQMKYLRAHIAEPFKMYAFLNGLQCDHRSKFFYSSSEPIRSHPIKLNLLADIATFNSTDRTDLLMFIDGDAFPVGDILSFGYQKLVDYPLIAVQRKENLMDIQPHPSFCLTTIGFWNDIGGDWKEGYKWQNAQGRSVTDVGGNLLGILNEKQIPWHPMLRSNRRELHVLWFGLYEDLIYHHGAGFRVPMSRLDLSNLGPLKFRYCKLYAKLPLKLQQRLPKSWLPLTKIREANKALSEGVYASILSDPFFYRFFQQGDPAHPEENSALAEASTAGSSVQLHRIK